MLPKGWKRVPLHKIAEVRTGLAKGKQGLKDPIELPYLRVANVQDGHIDLTEVKTIALGKADMDRYALLAGDVLMTEGGDFDKLGRGAVWSGEITPCLHQNHVFAVRPTAEFLNSSFLAALSASEYGRNYFLSCAKRSTNLASINSSQLKAFPVLLPRLDEQKGISEVLAVWDAAIATTEKLLANTHRQKQVLMQQLLTGKRRIQQFVVSNARITTRFGSIPADWQHVAIERVAQEFSAKNVADRQLPVLSCTKYAGLVDSLSYFNKRVFSQDVSTYKLVERGCFAYATNHIDEGSIGYQNLYDKALISPMYTVFKPGDEIDHGFLFKLLKTEHYRQICAANTNASVDRRGSLRWGDFKKIEIPLPSMAEQVAISSVIDSAQFEIENLERQLERLRDEKRALMQQLLTGKRRVRVPDYETVEA